MQIRGPLLAICCIAILAHGLPVSVPNEFNHKLQLDSEGKYIVHWKFNTTHITFEVHVETNGYVGFGISQNGDMPHSDVVVGWVKNGTVFFSDRHTTGHFSPVVDKQQDWFLLHGEENDQGTVLRFVRKLDTCDPNGNEDIAISDQTVRLVYSYHDTDPTDEVNLPYHGLHRGTKTTSLLIASEPPPKFQSEDVKILDLKNQNYLVPAKDTTYLCRGFQLPNIGGKHHLIQFEPIITPGNENHVHHIVVQRCPGSHPHLDGKNAECYWTWPRGWPMCPQIFTVWAVGGGAFYFPEDAGYPLGGPNDLNFFVMQIHYNNPTMKSDILDSSGIRFRITNKLRKYDAGGLNVGYSVTSAQVIPPHESAFVSRGYCSAQCISKAMNRTNVLEFKIIGQIQHAHLLASGIATRHFRNGTELSPIAYDPYYDFDVQEVRPVKPERTILPGDSITVECTYNTIGKTRPYFGGLSTREEMCLTFMYIVPDIQLMNCDSWPTFDTYGNTDSGNRRQEQTYVRTVLHEKFVNMTWSDKAVRDDFVQKLHNSTICHECLERKDGLYAQSWLKFKEDIPPFVPPNMKNTCQTSGN